MYIPKYRVVVTTQHVQNIETLDKTQNEQVQRLYLSDDDDAAEEVPASNTARAAEAGNTGRAAEAGNTGIAAEVGNADEAQATGGRAKSCKRRGKKSKKKKDWTRDRPVTRLAGKRAENEPDESAQREETGQDVVNNVIDVDPRHYREAMLSKPKQMWLEAIAEKLRALEDNVVWEIARMPRDENVPHTKWVYKTNRDAEGLIERLKARLVACENEQEFGVDYGITFAAVIEMSSVKLFVVLTRKWRAPTKHGDVPSAYVKADEEAELVIFIRLPQGMKIPAEVLERLGVTSEDELVLELKSIVWPEAGW
ncbi:hypothetical protein PI124_g18436 [Phytophthora idaei]|nr:hypothetical protein PI125_g19104 [Phytophthora idaei]KAG3136879.1 hypothetical protein PI126_g17630 [Phytophthora idaei]KAG3236556.1 hypothetical protein PI124_g18436 [Phytophthora idaei]